ncbi:MAG: helix-turn-helix domain-containing protein [Ignavibacteria bacterium]|nr:helix-turn-helix domain-containing protein [Ignavibacteria bacterium]
MNNSLNKTIKRLLILLLLLAINSSFAQTQKDVEQMIENFATAQANEQEAQLEEIISILLSKDTTYAREQVARLVEITANYESEDRALVKALSLMYSAYYGAPQKKIISLKKAFEVANRYKFFKIMGMAKADISDAYRQFFQYDSAMSALWDARLYFENANLHDEVISITHRIADYYYDADLPDRAEELYLELLKTNGKKTEKSWKVFRYIVLTNNLGLIEIKRKNYKKAEGYFLISLNNRLTYKGGILDKHDSTQLAYIYMQLTRVNLSQNRLTSANENYEKSLRFTQDVRWNENFVSLFILKAKIYSANSEYKPALDYLTKASDLSKTYASASIILELYSTYAEVYHKLKDSEKAYYWFQKYHTMKDSISIQKKAAAFLQIKAEKENEINRNEIISLQREKYILLTASAIILFGLGTLLVILFLKRKADRMLIDKSIEVMETEEKYEHKIVEVLQEEILKDEFETIVETAEDKVFDESNIKFTKIISRFEKIISEEKLYLNHTLNLEDLAERMAINRTYLSRAINQILKTNLNSYINDLRVKESIRSITLKESNHFSIEGIAKEVGFNNRTSFIAAFKKYTGVTPSFFIKKVNEEK